MRKQRLPRDLFGESPVPPRPLGIITRACLLLPPSFLLAVKFDLPHILIFASVLILIPCFFVHSLRMRERPVIYLSLMVFIMAFLPGFIIKVPESRLTFVDYLMRSHIFMPFLIYFAALLTWFRRSRGRNSVLLLISLISALICSDIFNTAGLSNTNFTGTTPLLKNYREVYRICVVLQCFGSLLLLTSTSRYDTVNRSKSLFFCRLAAFLFIPLLFFGARIVFFASEDLFSQWRNFVRQYIQRSANAHQSFFPARTSIGRPPEYSGDPVMLVQAIAPTAPGYLRGKAYRQFSEYDGGSWYADESKAVDLPEVEIEKDLAVLSFSTRPGWENDTEDAEIRFYMQFSGDVLPTSPRASVITLDAKNLAFSQEGCVLPEEWNYDSGCIFRMEAPGSAPTAAQYPDGAIMAAGSDRYRGYLDIPYRMRRQITSKALDIISNRNPESIAPRKRVNMVTQFLTDNYTYSLDPDLNFGNMYRSTVNAFLFQTKQGHCELFASAAALLLRALGVPTRYVVGVVCHDYHPSGYYYATDRDLHAWAEAWLDDEQCWIRVEATPAGSIGSQELPPEYSRYTIFSEKLKLKFDNLMYWVRRGYPARAVSHAWFAFYYSVRDYAIEHPLRTIAIFASLLSFLSGILVFIHFRNRRRYTIPENLRRAAALVLREQIRISARTGIRRATYHSMRSWAMQTGLPDLLAAVEYYESLRFSGHDCTRQDLARLRHLLRAARKRGGSA